MDGAKGVEWNDANVYRVWLVDSDMEGEKWRKWYRCGV